MILVFTHLICLVIGVISGMAGAFAVQGYLTLRRQLKETQAALEAREAALGHNADGENTMFAAFEKRRREQEQQGDTSKPTPDFMGGIGPTAIAARELYEREQAQIKSTPKFASPSVLNPSLADVKEAAREATENGRPN